ncbi:MAG: U32 family peptidase [Ruminococcus sp.]|jgi:putative protease|nr:U32 family peptidase [Ruminococcus sp.]
MISKRIEILSPAGDSERLHFAILYGADAVYVGTSQFSMRAAPPNFDRETLKKDVIFAHKNGVKVYLTCNTLPRSDEIESFTEYLHFADEIGIDALIISDLGLLSMARKELPKMEIHMSTQTGIVNYQTANALYDMGVKRVVLARELSLEEIKVIRAKTPPDLELECFVHGSMCVSFSGRCLLSEYLTGRDANRGLCAQACRWKYKLHDESFTLEEETRPGVHFPIEEDNNGTYILNASDLNMIEYLDELAEAGVTSFKIEGRAKSVYYVSIVTNAYKSGINLLETSNYFRKSKEIQVLKEELDKVSHRPYGNGFFIGTPKQHFTDSGYIRDYDIAAVVIKNENGRIYCEQRNKILPETDIEIVIPYTKNYTDSIFISTHIGKIYDSNDSVTDDTRHAKMLFSFDYEGMDIPEGSIIRVKELKKNIQTV